MTRAILGTVICVIGAFLVLPGTELRAGADDLSVSGYSYVGRVRVGRTHYDYTYRITVANAGDALQNVVANASSTAANVEILDGVVPIE